MKDNNVCQFCNDQLDQLNGYFCCHACKILEFPYSGSVKEYKTKLQKDMERINCLLNKYREYLYGIKQKELDRKPLDEKERRILDLCNGYQGLKGTISDFIKYDYREISLDTRRECYLFVAITKEIEKALTN